MPFLDWVNKNQAKERTRGIPIHLLKQEAVYGGSENSAPDNLLIQGDNLLALKALLPVYGGRVKCIFIDPPYNTQSAFAHRKVKHWVRNIERQERFSFWLPTSTDYFYPDFVAELIDGRLLVVEYKGEPYKTNDDSREKVQVGNQWEKSSNGRCLFLFAVADDDRGRPVHK